MKVFYPQLMEFQGLLGLRSLTIIQEDAHRLIPVGVNDYTITSECETREGADVLVTVKYARNKEDGNMDAVKYTIEWVVGDL